MHEEELLTSKNSFNRLQCIILKFIIFINLGFESYIILSLNYLHPRPEKFPPPYLCGPNYVFIEKNWSENRLADRFHCADSIVQDLVSGRCLTRFGRLRSACLSLSRSTCVSIIRNIYYKITNLLYP